MTDADEYVWMTAVLSAWRKHGYMWKPVQAFKVYSGLDDDAALSAIKTLQSGGNVTFKYPASLWLANYFRPVSDALIDGATDAKAMKLWQKTKRDNLSASKRELDHLRAQTNRAVLDSATALQQRRDYKQGWRAKHDWNIVK